MTPKVFCTGVTGYIGGDTLSQMVDKYPDWEITSMVRNSDKGAKVASIYPRVKLVYGDLDSIELIEEESAKADIVYNFANCDHEAAATAIVKGLNRRESSSPGYLIHTSGALILGTKTIEQKAYGNDVDDSFDDWEGVTRLVSQPDHAAHRNVDKIVLAAGSEKVKVAIVCPPCIYGIGRGPDNQRSVQMNRATTATLQRQKAFVIGAGENSWNTVHVQDLCNVYLALGDSAAKGGPPATWNDQGYYLAENGSVVWGDILKKMAKVAHAKGLLPTDEVDIVDADQAAQIMKSGQYLTGTNSKGTAIRARKLFDWKPTQPSLEDLLSELVEGEAKLLGLIKGHAETVEK